MIGCGVVLVIGIAIWWYDRADGRLHLVMPPLDGDGILVVAPGGQTVLVDGGSDGAAVATWLGRELPFRRRLDLLVLTRADRTTLPGHLAAARRYAIGAAVLVRPSRPDPQWHELVRLLQLRRVPIRYPQTGERLRLVTSGEDSIVLRVLGTNGERLALLVGAGSTSVALFHSLGTPTPTVPAASSVSVLFYPWRRSVFDPAIQRLAPAVVVYGEQPGTDPRRSFAERRIGAARLLHEAIDGRIEVVVDAQGTVTRQE